MKLRPLHISLMTRRLADLTNGGMTLSRSLEVLSGQTANIAVQNLLRSLNREIRNGTSFSQALEHQNGFFSPVYVGLVRAGELSGNVEKTLEELARSLEEDLDTRQRIRAALAYPAVLLALAVAVCIFLTVFVIPRFEFLFQDLGQRLPLPTRVLIGSTVFFKKSAWLILPVTAAAGWLFHKNPSWRKKIQIRALQLPGIAGLNQSAGLARWTATMASLLRGGFTVPEALSLSRHAAGDLVCSEELRQVLKNILEGKSLASSLGRSPFFPPLLCELTGAGEESGRLEQTFERLAASFKRDTELKIKTALSLLEPALILGMGVVVGFVALAMLLPIFEISASIR